MNDVISFTSDGNVSITTFFIAFRHFTTPGDYKICLKKKAPWQARGWRFLHLPLIFQQLLTELAPSQMWGLLQLHRADPSAAPDKIVNLFFLLLRINNKPVEYS